MIGKTYFSLACISEVVVESDTKAWYLFRCTCGNERTASGLSVRQGNIKSCKDCKPKCRHKGSGDISINWWNAHVLKQWKKRKRGRGSLLGCSISISFAWELFIRQERRCALTGLELMFPKKFTDYGTGTASLDRIDSTVGYHEGNVQWVHKDINMAKQRKNNTEFVQLCTLVVENQRAKSLTS